MRKQNILKFFLVVAIIMVAINAKAQEFETGGIKYNITNTTTKTVGVMKKDPVYTGDITIPSTVKYESETYSVTSFEEYAFDKCAELTSINIPNSVVNIKNQVFGDCTGLTNINIPLNVAEIGEYAFTGCENLISFVVDTENKFYSSSEGVFFNKNKTLLIQCPGKKSGEYTISGSVKRINDCAFDKCAELTSINIPNSVTNIGHHAFSKCTGLTSINIPNSIKYIAWCTFLGCESLTEIIIPGSVERIHGYAFANTGLSSIIIPNSVTNLAYRVFYECKKLTSVTISNKITKIEESTFYECSSLTSIQILNNITSIEEKAFSKCSSLVSITIPNSVKSIEDKAFSYCSNLTSISIPSSVASIGSFVFNDCIKLTEINVDDANPSYSSVEGVFFNKDKTTLIKYPEGKTLTNYKIPNSVTKLEEEAFSNCLNLTSVKISNTVKDIGNSVFSRCTKLTSVSIPGSVNRIGQSAFNWCTNLTSLICHIEIPLEVGIENFYDVELSNCTLYVPFASIDAYKAAAVWKGFGTIKAIVEVSGVSLDKTSLTLKPGAEETLTATLTPEDVTEDCITWTSSNDSIVTIDTKGKITAHKEGVATITVTTADGGYSAACTVKVEKNTTAIENIEKAKISFYPNPTTGLLNYSFKNNNIQKIMVSDISGRNILTYEVKNSEGSIDLSAHEPGIYILFIYTEKEVLTSKIIKE